ncbi:unnamed protein product [Brassica oleracea]
MRLIQFWIPNCNRVVDRPGLVGYIEDTDDGFDVVGAALGFCVGTRRSKPPTPLLFKDSYGLFLDQSKLLMKLQVDSKASVAASSFYVTSLQLVLSGGPSTMKRHELHS